MSGSDAPPGGRMHEAVRRPPERVMRAPGAARRPRCRPRGSPTPRGARPAAPRLSTTVIRPCGSSLEHAMPEGRRRIGPVERHRPVAEDASDRRAPSATIRSSVRVARGEGRAERVAVAAVAEASRGGCVQTGPERPGVGPCGRGRVKCAPWRCGQPDGTCAARPGFDRGLYALATPETCEFGLPCH